MANLLFTNVRILDAAARCLTSGEVLVQVRNPPALPAVRARSPQRCDGDRRRRRHADAGA